MTINTEWDNEIRETEAVKQQAVRKLGNLYQLRAEFLCPVKVGDKVINIAGRKAVVSEIKTDYSTLNFGDGYEFYIRLINKDGAAGARSSRAWHDEKWVKEN